MAAESPPNPAPTTTADDMYAPLFLIPLSRPVRLAWRGRARDTRGPARLTTDRARGGVHVRVQLDADHEGTAIGVASAVHTGAAES